MYCSSLVNQILWSQGAYRLEIISALRPKGLVHETSIAPSLRKVWRPCSYTQLLREEISNFIFCVFYYELRNLNSVELRIFNKITS